MLIPNSFRIFAETKHRYTFLYSFSRSCSGLFFKCGCMDKKRVRKCSDA